MTTRKFVDYDLSNMRDSKGGFIVEETKKQKLEVVYDHLILPSVDPTNTDKENCSVCNTNEKQLDPDLFRYYGVKVCRDCRNNNPERFTLLTKTEVKEDYLLTDEELRDKDKMPHWEKANPRKNTYAKMKLYLREQVEKFAYEKWGGSEGLDNEFQQREDEKNRKKEHEFKNKMKALRKQTRTSLWKPIEKTSLHEHEYTVNDGEHTCKTCGLVLEFEEF